MSIDVLASNESPEQNNQISNAPYLARFDKPWGWEVHWTPPWLPYVGKLLHINAGARLSLQLHEEKHESWLLIRGVCRVLWDDCDGELVETRLMQGNGYSCAPGQRHRLIAITECDVVEASTPERGTTWRLEDDYQRPHETPAQRLLERHGRSGTPSDASNGDEWLLPE